MLITKKIYIKSRGRLYFTGFCGTEKVTLLIDDLTTNLPVDHIVVADIDDHLSTFSKYGAKLRYVAHKIISVQSKEEARAAGLKKQLDSMLGFAQADVAKGFYQSNAITFITDFRAANPDHELKEVLKDITWKAYQNWQQECLRKEELKARRDLCDATSLPPLNTPIKTEDGEYIVYTGYGRQFAKPRQRKVFQCYCYFRAATDAEIAEIDEEKN